MESSLVPVKRTRIIQREYWDCGIESHNHQTEAVAAECISARFRGKNHRTDKVERKLGQLLHDIEFAKRLIGGDSFSIIAKEACLSVAAIRERFYRLMRKSQAGQLHAGVTLAPATHLVYPAGLFGIRKQADGWLQRLCEVEQALKSTECDQISPERSS